MGLRWAHGGLLRWTGCYSECECKMSRCICPWQDTKGRYELSSAPHITSVQMRVLLLTYLLLFLFVKGSTNNSALCRRAVLAHLGSLEHEECAPKVPSARLGNSHGEPWGQVERLFLRYHGQYRCDAGYRTMFMFERWDEGLTDNRGGKSGNEAELFSFFFFFDEKGQYLACEGAATRIPRQRDRTGSITCDSTVCGIFSAL